MRGRHDYRGPPFTYAGDPNVLALSSAFGRKMFADSVYIRALYPGKSRWNPRGLFAPEKITIEPISRDPVEIAAIFDNVKIHQDGVTLGNLIRHGGLDYMTKEPDGSAGSRRLVVEELEVMYSSGVEAYMLRLREETMDGREASTINLLLPPNLERTAASEIYFKTVIPVNFLFLNGSPRTVIARPRGRMGSNLLDQSMSEYAPGWHLRSAEPGESIIATLRESVFNPSHLALFPGLDSRGVTFINYAETRYRDGILNVPSSQLGYLVPEVRIQNLEKHPSVLAEIRDLIQPNEQAFGNTGSRQERYWNYLSHLAARVSTGKDTLFFDDTLFVNLIDRSRELRESNDLTYAGLHENVLAPLSEQIRTLVRLRSSYIVSRGSELDRGGFSRDQVLNSLAVLRYSREVHQTLLSEFSSWSQAIRSGDRPHLRSEDIDRLTRYFDESVHVQMGIIQNMDASILRLTDVLTKL